MIIQVEDLIKLNSFSNCRLVGGASGLSKEVRWFWVCYTDEITQWVKGKEIAFVTGIIEWSPQSIAKLMRNFQEHNISAVFLLQETFLPSAPEEMIAMANEYDIPLFEMPNTTPLVDITRTLAQLLLQNKRIEYQIGDILKNCIFGHNIDRPRHEHDLMQLGFRLKNANYLFVFELANYISEGDAEKITEYYHSAFYSCALDGPFFFYKERYIILCVASMIELLPAKITNKCQVLIQSLVATQNKYSVKSVGISDVFSEMQHIKRAYCQALQAIKVVEMGPYDSCIQQYSQINSITKIMMEVDDFQIIQNCYMQTIGKLVEYDQKHKTDFLRTFEVYFMENGNIVRSAKALNIHRNTMIYRVERINVILTCSIEDMDTRLRLMIDLHLYRHRNCHPKMYSRQRETQSKVEMKNTRDVYQ